MGQITTYGSGRVTQAQKRAAEERAKESAHIAEAERREALRAAGKTQLDKLAIELALEAERNVSPPDPAKLAAEAEAAKKRRAADKRRFAKLVKRWEQNRDSQYEGLTMMFDAIFSDMELAVETLGLAKKLGTNNPIERGTMMHVADGLSGVPQDKMHLVERICEKIIDRYRKAGAIDRYNFELPV